jgi:hypothetical protein
MQANTRLPPSPRIDTDARWVSGRLEVKGRKQRIPDDADLSFREIPIS